tara:strand:- start:1113 stop:1262 length:150 start_codon:yes stop_codon:yes gene_type:complete
MSKKIKIELTEPQARELGDALSEYCLGLDEDFQQTKINIIKRISDKLLK